MTTSEQPKPNAAGAIVGIITLALAGYLIYQSIALLNL